MQNDPSSQLQPVPSSNCSLVAHHTCSSRPRAQSPANARRKGGTRKSEHEEAQRTLSFSPKKRAHPLWTNASLAATTATMLTPFALSSSIFSRNGGRWFTWQVGCVYAPQFSSAVHEH